MQKIKIIFKCVLIAAMLFVLAIFVQIIIEAKNNPGEIKSVMGYIPMTVISGSMQPELNPGDLIIVKESGLNKINCNDIISFKFNDNKIITHRAVEILKDSGESKILTKGDANDFADGWQISKENIIGIVCLKIPFLGYFVKLMASWKGLMIMLVIPLFILISGELKEVLLDKSKDKRQLILINRLKSKHYKLSKEI
ncbi:MAG: signal peptidase I [Ignavibacteriales bacterium]